MSGVASVTMLVAMVGVRTAALLALMKILALQFGTAGFGQLSQVLAIAALFSVLAGGGLTNGIVRNLAASADAVERVAWIRAALPIAAASAVAMAAIAIALYFTAADALFPGERLGFVLIVIAGSQAVVGLGNIALAHLSGTHDVRAYAIANSAGSIAAAGFVALLAWTGGFRGAATGIDVTRVVRTGILPQINTGIAGRVAGTGQVGAGLVTPPIECFLSALTALASAAAPAE